MRAVGEYDLITHKRDGQRGGGARSGETRHELRLTGAETHQANAVGGEDFAGRARDNHHAGGDKYTIVRSHRLDIDDHAHADEEIRHKEGIAYEIDVVHQWSGGRNLAVERQSDQECAQDTFHTYPFHEAGAEENERQHEDVLHHIVVEAAEKAPTDPREHHHDARTQCQQSRAEQQEVEAFAVGFVGAAHNGEHQERENIRNDGGAHRNAHRAVLRQAPSHHHRVG